MSTAPDPTVRSVEVEEPPPDPGYPEEMFRLERDLMLGFTDWSAADREAITAPTLVIADAQARLPGLRPCGFHSPYEAAAAWSVLSRHVLLGRRRQPPQ